MAALNNKNGEILSGLYMKHMLFDIVSAFRVIHCLCFIVFRFGYGDKGTKKTVTRLIQRPKMAVYKF